MQDSTSKDAAAGKPLDADELEQQVIHMIGLGSTVVAGAALLSVGPGPSFNWWRILVYFVLTAESAAIWWASGKHVVLAKALLLLSPALSLALALRVIPNPGLPYFAVLAVLANSAVSVGLGLTAAILNTVVLCGLVSAPDPLTTALALVWLAALLQWSSVRGRSTLLEWAWNSQRRATRLLEELRDRQGKLNRALHAMDEANARLALANERLTEARRLAEDARQAKTRFVVNVSHELRTPLNVIVGFAEVMHNTPQAYPDVVLSPRFLVDLGAIYRNAQHLQKLVDDVLDLAQLEAGKFALQPVKTDLAALVQDAVDTIRNLATVRGLDLVVRLAPDLPDVYVDRTRIKQVLLNLLSNAIRYTEEGTVAVSATMASDRRAVSCSVTDTGAGIPEEQQRRLFEEFERIGAARTSSLRGSGLGLAISKRLIREHGGSIRVESRPGMGSTFTFTLPALDADALSRPAPVATQPVPEAPRADRDLALLLTRSVMAARLFTRHLESYRCISTADAQQAIQQIADLQPRGIVVDAALGEDTVALVRDTVRHGSIPNVPLIVCPMPDPAQTRGLGEAKGYLPKPISRRDLLDMLRTLGREVETILAVDDDEDVLRLFTRYLCDDVARPYEVLVARSGGEALAMMRSRQPDLVLLDLVMPAMDGYHVLREMQAEPALSRIPVIVISGQDVQDEQPAIEDWLHMQMPKGMPVDHLVRAVDRLLKTLQDPGSRKG